MQWSFNKLKFYFILLAIIIQTTEESKKDFKKNYATASQAEEKMYEFLFKKYNKQIRPVLNEEDAVNVTFGLSLNQIIDVDEKNQMLTISAWIRQVWYNPILSWNPKNFNGIQSININPKTVWLPDIVLYNNADEDKSFGGNMDRMNTRIILTHTGKNMWLAPIILKSKCPINVRYFPFDEQRCSLKFGSWTYDGFRLNLQAESDNADLDKYLNNTEWHLVSVPIKRNEIVYYCCPQPYYDVTFTLIIRRRSLFYLTNLIFPMVVIIMLTIMAFVLPAESGERVSLAITLLLSMTVFMLVVADIIPPTSEVIPLVGVFFSSAMIEMVIMIFVLCYTLRLYHKGSSDAPMPHWMRRYLLNWLSYKLWVRKTDQSTRTKNGSRGTQYVQQPYSTHNTPERTYVRGSETREMWVQKAAAYAGMTEHKKMDSAKCHGQLPSRGNDNYNGAIQMYKLPANNNTCKCHCETMKHLNVITERINSDQEEQQHKEEWRIVAKTVDQCLLILFVFVVFLTTFICFSQAPSYVP